MIDSRSITMKTVPFILVLLLLGATGGAMASPILSGRPVDEEAAATLQPDLPQTLDDLGSGTAAFLVQDQQKREEDVSDSAAARARNPTLGQVLRTLVNRGSSGSVDPFDSDPTAAQGTSRSDGVAQMLLDNETLGRALRSTVEIREDGNGNRTFSVFGVGNFEIGVQPTLPNAVMSEQYSARAAAGGADQGDDREPPMAHAQENMLLSTWGLFEQFLSSPIGILLALVAAIYLLLWNLLKLAGVVRRLKFANAPPPPAPRPEPAPRERSERPRRHSIYRHRERRRHRHY